MASVYRGNRRRPPPPPHQIEEKSRSTSPMTTVATAAADRNRGLDHTPNLAEEKKEDHDAVETPRCPTHQPLLTQPCAPLSATIHAIALTTTHSLSTFSQPDPEPSHPSVTGTMRTRASLGRSTSPYPTSWLIGYTLGRISFLLVTSAIHLFLLLTVVGGGATVGLQHVHDVYLRPLLARAVRTDDDLLEEMTYYTRPCTAYDITTTDVRDLLLTLPSTHPDPVYHDDDHRDSMLESQVMDKMLTHGAMVIPHVLQPTTVRHLRDYIVERNAATRAEEAYPMSQGHRRLSYGLDAATDNPDRRHPALANALHEIASHPVLRPALALLLGDPDPAIAEITVITAYPGAPDQVWHQDTKADGNAITFARTYSHSYSLFLPLQNTTAAMGSTELLPGTHYCANDLESLGASWPMCLSHVGHALADHNATLPVTEPFFPAGYGALLNQHVWHRGSAHTDFRPDAQERIVFIVSFLARPQYERSATTAADHRQLSRGTYFHLKWNMWGHTWHDLYDPLQTMTPLWSILRSLSLYKSPSAQWGYDLITATMMRMANEQLEYGELRDRLIPRLHQLRFPAFLHGTVHDEDDVGQRDMWLYFVQDTLRRTRLFFLVLAGLSHFSFLVLTLVASLVARQFIKTPTTSTASKLTRVLRRWMLLYCSVLFLGVFLHHKLAHSPWGIGVRTGRLLRRPFPSFTMAPHPKEVEAGLIPSQSLDRHPTTLPHRSDVLLGTRYDAPFLGSYDQWLEYHPGNQFFRHLTETFDPIIRSELPFSLVDQVVARIMNEINNINGDGRAHNSSWSAFFGVGKNQGRFLFQNYRTGDWVVLPRDEAFLRVRTILIMSASPRRRLIDQSIRHQTANYRFGEFRGAATTPTVLSRLSQLYLLQWQQRIVSTVIPIQAERLVRMQRATKRLASFRVASATAKEAPGLRLRLWHPLFAISKVHAGTPVAPFLSRHSGPAFPSSSFDSTVRATADAVETFGVGALVVCSFKEKDVWFSGTVMKVHSSVISPSLYSYDISFEDDTYEENVSAKVVQRFRPIRAGTRIVECDGDEEKGGDESECFPGLITRVFPTGEVDVLFDNGDSYSRVSPSAFYLSEYGPTP